MVKSVELFVCVCPLTNQPTHNLLYQESTAIDSRSKTRCALENPLRISSVTNLHVQLKKRMPFNPHLLQHLQEAFVNERDLPYHIPLARNEVDTTCAGKHLRLMRFCQNQHIPVRQRIVFFHWEDLALPKEILALNREKNPSHLYVEISNGETWNAIDATWDPGLKPLLPINTWADFAQGMRVAVEPTKTLSPEASHAYMNGLKSFNVEAHLKKQRPFLEALNNYFEEMRSRV